MKKIEYLF